MKKVFKVNLKHNESEEEEWSQVGLFCPNCGQFGVWHYDGPEVFGRDRHLCLSCKGGFNVHSVCSPDYIDRQRLKHLSKED